jgi:hypothetical protein
MRFRLIPLFFLFIFSVPVFAQKAPSPEEFLGYSLGSRFTPHYKILQYVEAVAKANPTTMKFESYGKTYEQRLLVTVTIASPENLQKLESIRLNNLRLAGVAKDKIAPDEKGPVIVWMSYNVHGSEPASSEAAMKTIYAFADPENPKTKEWLKNTVLIIDPCINPDGRDRYVNWYNSVHATTPDPEPQAREHQESWPGGRTNHYNFDLNRDWAWQSQIETQQRLKIYNEWLPQIHVDFHEQGFNSPYYFAPAAEPFHEVITPWQREFQVLIGRNHAKYFDNNGWLYFTKERFDLLYPSYGDTYPTYSGAIGMTFEQGGIGGGLAVIQESGDTLTLKDRLEHHFTTGLSTVEVASTNAPRLLKEYRKFFADGVANGSGEYKSYIIKLNAGRPELDNRLRKFLDKNGITYQYASDNKSYKVYNYISGKEESQSFENSDLVISALQPKAALLRVLFEPRSRITDSATYDVTAWSIPYAWGLNAFASRDNVSAKTNTDSVFVGRSTASTKQPIGYAIAWNDLSSVKILSSLLKAGIKVRYAEEAFQVGDKKFDRGSLLVLKTSNAMSADSLFEKVFRLVAQAGSPYSRLTPIQTGFVDKGADMGSSKVKFLKKPKVALFTGQGVSSYAAGEIWHFFEQDLKYPISMINVDNAASLKWFEYDVVIMPEGNYRFLNEKPNQDMFKSWIRQGGRVIALESAVAQLANLELGIKSKKEEEKKDTSNGYSSIKRFENRERDFLPNTIPGAVYKIELDNSHPLAFGLDSHYFTLKMDDNIYEFLKEGWNVGTVKKESYVSGFAGSKTKARLKDGVLIGAIPIGRGNLVFFADDPIFRSFWDNGKLLLANAIFMVD